MMALDKREAEIPLSGGMNTSQGAEFQSVDTLRLVQDLRINADGEWERRPGAVTVATVTDPGNGAYTSTEADALIESRGEIYALTRNFGVLNEESRYVGAGGGDISAGSIPYVSTLNPIACRVGRLTVDRTSASDSEQGFCTSASCTYASTTLVLASCSYAASGSGCILRLQAMDIATGAVLAQVQYDNDIVGSTAWAVDACENTDAAAPGAVITWAMGNGAPFTIRKYRYIASSKSFVYDAALTTDASVAMHRIKTSPTAAGRFILAFNLNTGNVLRAYDIACTAGTIGTAISSHAGTHAAAGGIDIAMSGTSILIASISAANTVANSVYAERYGTPAAAITVATASGTAYYMSVAVARETSSTIATRAVIWASVTDYPATGPQYIYTDSGTLTFTATTVVETIALGTHTRDNVYLLGFGVSAGDRAYALFGASQNYITAHPSAFWVRGGQIYAGSLMSDNPVARVAHDILAWYPQATVSTNLMSTFVVNDEVLYSTVPTDFSEDNLDGPAALAAQTISLVRCEIGNPVTHAKNAGVASVASGVLFDIDGANAMVSQALAPPVIQLADRAAGATTGTFLVTAIYRWTDAAGREHRSAPAVPVSSGALVNRFLDVYVTKMPWEVFSDTIGIRTYSIDVYITAAGGSAYYLANTAGGSKRTSYSLSNGCRVYTNVLAGVTTNPQPYSMGTGAEALVSEPPPAPLSVCAIGDRLWVIDAEDRTRVWFTKPFEDGFAPEWNTANTLTIGDEGVGISDVNGVPTVLCERGIWQIYGDGPNALGIGSFAPARRLPHEIECLDARSICKTSMGVAFRARRGVMMLGNDGSLQELSAPISGEIAITGPVTGYCKIAYDELMNELHVLDFDESHWVLNLGEGKWSKWTQDVNIQNWTDAITVNGRVNFVHAEPATPAYEVNRCYAIDEASYNVNEFGYVIETPWIRFDGVTGNMRIWEVIVQVRLGAPDVDREAIAVVYQTRDGLSETFTFSASDLNNAILNASSGDTVNLRCRVTQQRTKQFKLTITDGNVGSYSGNTPIAARVIYGVTPGGDSKRSTSQNKGSTVVG